MSIGIEKVPMGIFFDLKSVRKPGGEWSCGEKAIGIVEEALFHNIKGSLHAIRIVVRYELTDISFRKDR